MLLQCRGKAAWLVTGQYKGNYSRGTLHVCPPGEGELWWSDQNEYSENQNNRDLSDIPREYKTTEWVLKMGQVDGRMILRRDMASGAAWLNKGGLSAQHGSYSGLW